MNDALQTLETILRQHQLHVTKPRRTVFTALYDQPPRYIGELIRATASSIDRVSVYRTVELFERLGIVRVVPVGWKHKIELSDAFSKHHHHATCRRCGRVIDLPENHTLERLIASIAAEYHIHNSSHILEIQGICTHCAQTKKS